jgi:acyl carrier protein
MSETADRVKKIVVEHLGVDAEKVTEEASFIDDLGADSLDIVELVMAFEEEFGVENTDDAAEKITTVKYANSFIDSNKGKSLNLIAGHPVVPALLPGAVLFAKGY